MDNRLNYWLSVTFQTIILAFVAATPFLFWNLTSEFYETPKFLLLLVTTGILLILWVLRCVFMGKVAVTRTPLDIPLLLILAIFAISAFFAPAKAIAIVGNLPRIHGGLASFGAYILFYFVLVSNLKQLNVARQLVHLLLISGVILSILSLLSYFGMNILPLNWTSAINFTPTGSSFSTTAILALLIPFPLMNILGKNADHNSTIKNLATWKGFVKITSLLPLPQIISAVTLGLFLITIALTGSFATYLAAGIAFLLTLFSSPPSIFKKSISFIALPLLLTLIITIFSTFSFGGSQNVLYTKSQAFPREIQLPLNESWKISISAFRDSPFWGTGPSTFLFNFTTYKPAEFNTSKFWNIRFDQAFNEYLQFLGTLGATGLIALLLLTIVFASLAFKSLASPKYDLVSPLAIAGITFFVVLMLHTSTTPLWIIGIIILALFMITHKDGAEQLLVGLATVKSEGKQNFKFDALPGMLLILVVILVGATLYSASNLALADYHHRLALNAVGKGDGMKAYNELVIAERLNPNADLYRTDLAQTNFALANALASSKGPSESTPGGNLTDADKQNIQTLLSQAINEGRAATSLSPSNAGNWEVLGSIYRQISGVAQNAITFSLDSYGKAIQYDPLNPSLRLTVGGIYYSTKNYDSAIRFFSDAINLKPDYANAYYNLAIVLKDKGDLQSAIAAAEKTVSLIDPQNPDYKAASALLADLKTEAGNKTTTADSKPPVSLEPEATKSSALQNKKLPKVLDLNKLDKTSTPSTVQAP